MIAQETPEQHAEHMRWFLNQSPYRCFTCRGGPINIGGDMGASRYMAVEAFTDEQLGWTFAPGDFVTGSDYERMGDPEAFRPAEFPEQIAALRDAHGITDQPSGRFDPAEHTVDEVNAHLRDADEDEKMRVLDAERSSDNPRKGILEA